MVSQHPAPDEIQLHFCQSCGISIPQGDIDSERARSAPGGYICAGCVYQQRDHDLVGERIVSAAAPRTETGTRVLAALAIFYVVGATTFLLFREINREPPAFDLSEVATTTQVARLGGKLDQLDDRTRRALQELKDNDLRHRAGIKELGGRIESVEESGRVTAARLRSEISSVGKGVLELAQRTLGLKGSVDQIMKELRGLSRRSATPVAPSQSTPTVKENPRATPPAGPTKEELEREKLLKEYLAQLLDRKASDRIRYNAAVQLGDLKHPGALDGLLAALEKDPNDLVRRAAAWSIGMLGKQAVKAIPALIGEIGSKQEFVGYMCERALGEITKAVLGKAQTFNFDPNMSSRERKKVQRLWQEWWKKNSARFGVSKA